MRELLYNAAKHFKRGKALSERGDARGAMVAFEEALKDLHAVKPQRMRDVLLAQVYLSRYVLGQDSDPLQADSDLRLGYSYARTTAEPTVRHLAETLWEERRRRPPLHLPRGWRPPRTPPTAGAERRDQQGGARQERGGQGGTRQAGDKQAGDRQGGDRQGGRGRGGRRGGRTQGERRGGQ